MNANTMMPAAVEEVSALGLVMNAALAIALFYLASVPVAREWMTSAAFRYTVWTFVFLSNCFLLGPIAPFFVYAWHYAVLYPTSLVAQTVRPIVEWVALATGEPGDMEMGDRIDVATLAISSRIYYVLALLIGSVTPKGLRVFHQRVLQPSPDRWWQFSLRGWFALTIIIGLILSVCIWLASG